MPNVFYSTRPYPAGKVVDTRDYCAANRRALLRFPREVSEVEFFLESIRLEIERRVAQEGGPEEGELRGNLPQRTCSFFVVPWPESQEGSPQERRVRTKASQQAAMRSYGEAQDPPGRGLFCYYVIPKQDHKYAIVDERWVYELEDRWSEIADSDEARQMAYAYWTSQLYGISDEPGETIGVLLEGKVFIHGVCRSPMFVA